MLMRPSILLLDEPTVGLDPVARGTVWETLKKFRQQYPLSILITTHYMDEAEAICDRVAIMNQGHIAAMDTPTRLKEMTGLPGATLEDAFRSSLPVENTRRMLITVGSNVPARLPGASVDNALELQQSFWLKVWLRGIAGVVELEVRKLWHRPDRGDHQGGPANPVAADLRPGLWAPAGDTNQQRPLRPS